MGYIDELFAEREEICESDEVELIVFWNEDNKCFEATDVECSGDLLYVDIAHLLSKEPVISVVVDELI